MKIGNAWARLLCNTPYTHQSALYLSYVHIRRYLSVLVPFVRNLEIPDLLRCSYQLAPAEAGNWTGVGTQAPFTRRRSLVETAK